MTTIWEQVSAGAKLVSLPGLYMRLRSVLDDPDFAMSDVAELISSDPGMSARLLRLVNSAFFGVAAKIETVSRATSLLGTQQVHDLVLATSVAESFDGMPDGLVDMNRYWQTSVHCGVLSRLLAEECNVLDSERLFVAGLLRDIGHLIMYQTIPDLCRQAMERAANEGESLYLSERALIGLDYARVGGVLMRQWNLPKPLVHATELHIEPARATENTLETGIVHLAAAIVDSFAVGESAGNWQERVDENVWKMLSVSLSQCEACMVQAEDQLDQVLQLVFPQITKAAI